MKNRITIITTAVICLGLAMGLGFAHAGNQIQVPDQTITIKGKKPVKFNHTTHLDLGISCGQCHHDEKHQPRTVETIAAMADSATLQCATCHNSDFTNPKLQKPKNIFHARCKTCHKEGYNDKKGPTKCTGCHGKKKKKVIEGC